MTPDTVISLTNGQKFIVRETSEEVVERVVQFRRSLLGAEPNGSLQVAEPKRLEQHVSGAS